MDCSSECNLFRIFKLCYCSYLPMFFMPHLIYLYIIAYYIIISFRYYESNAITYLLFLKETCNLWKLNIFVTYVKKEIFTYYFCKLNHVTYVCLCVFILFIMYSDCHKFGVTIIKFFLFINND